MITPFGELPNNLAADMSLAEQHEWLARRLSRRRLLAGAAGVGALAITSQLWTQTARADSSTSVYGQHVTYGAEPSTTMIVSFAVTGSFQSATVTVTGPNGGKQSLPADAQAVAGSTSRYCRAAFSALTPDSAYTYYDRARRRRRGRELVPDRAVHPEPLPVHRLRGSGRRCGTR